MWHNLHIKNVGRIKKIVAEFTITMIPILPYATMKVKIYESQTGHFTGATNLAIKRKFDDNYEFTVGSGDTIQGALENTILKFNEKMSEDDYLELNEQDISYADWTDF
ncbi:hypothetical protein VQ643_16070 [Pseudomonas sp. F1_0610]|uniref:hypothetical protein n=1 Tax=Pseudomonas sp. F1_0610 TaxID=3114284 RepID=UPI0039C4DE1D